MTPETALDVQTRSPPGAWAALGVALTLPMLMSYLYFVLVAPPTSASEPPETNPWMQGLYALAKVVQFSWPIVWLALADRRRLRPRWPGWRGTGLGLAFGAVVGVSICALFWALLDLSPSPSISLAINEMSEKVRRKMAESGLSRPLTYVAFGAFLCLGHSLLEEWYWRWFVHGELRRLLPWAAAVTVSSLGFMAHHVVLLAVYFPGRFFTMAVPLSLCIAVGGAFWAFLYDRTGSLVGPWLSHALVDSALIAVGYRLLFG
jgi:membrane protease YdiL (CAAX protease family)